MKKNTLSALAFVAFASCSNISDETIITNNEVQITSSIATRTSGNNWEAEDKIGVFMTTYNDTFAGLGKNILYSTEKGDGLFVSSTPLYYPPSDNVDLLAYYPHKTTTTDAGVYSVNVAIQTDQGAIDMMVATVTNQVKTTNAVDLTFDHKLSNIVLNVVNGDGYADLAAIGTISKIELSGSTITAEYDLTDDSIELGSDSETIEFVVAQSDTAITAEAIIIPQTLSGSSATLSVTTEAGAVHTVALNGTFAIGTQYSYTLNLNLTELNISGATINDWNKISGGELEGTVPEPIWDGSYPASTDEAIATLGSVDANGAYQIGGVDKFAAFAYLVNNDYNNYKDADVVLTNNLDLDSEEWTPIGSSSAPYTGTFDGGGYEVLGLSIDQSSNDNQGLFGYISEATITNVSVSGSVSGKGFIGGVVGHAVSNSTITYCNNSATIIGNSDQVGGIVGYNETSCTITNCTNSGDITSSSGYGSVGGIVGSTNYIVKNCSNSGTITATGSSYRNVGGVAGYAGSGSSVTACYNSGVVVASGTSDNNVGGVVGNNCNSTVASCYNTGKVSGGTYTGGVVGYNNYITITTITTNCYNIGDVSNGYSTCSVVGYNTGTITSCYYLDSTAMDGNATAKSETEIQDKGFVTTLNSDAYSYNETSPWVYNEGAYPTLNFDAE